MSGVPAVERHGPSIAAAAALASHLTALGGGYVWLDHAHLEEGLALAAPADWLSLFTRGFAGTGFYRPLMALSLSIDAAVSKTPGFFRAVTLGWHAAAAFLAVVAARALGLSARAALAAGLLFAVHPATSLVASATAFRSEAMIAVSLFAVIAAHLQRKPLLAALSLAAGALTKETAWVLGPLFVLVLELTGPHEERPLLAEDAPRRRLLGAEAFAFAVATLLRFRFAPPFRASFPGLTFDESVGSRLAALEKTAVSVLVPFDTGMCDAFPATRIGSATALGGALVLGAVGLLAVRRRRIAMLFALSLLPSLQLVPVMRWWSPHYFYVALAFGAMLVGEALDRLSPRGLQIAAALAVPLAGLSLREGSRYESDVTLWEPEVKREPSCREGHFFLGEVARNAEKWDVAAAHYERAAEPVPGYLAYADEFAALQNLGAVRIAQERWTDARAAWTSALGGGSDSGERRRVVHNLAVLALRMHDPAEAARLLEPEMTAETPLAESLFVRARALHELGRDAEAREIIDRLKGGSRAGP